MADFNLTLVCPSSSLTALQSYWNEFAQRWPLASAPPTILPVALDDALCDPGLLTGVVTLVTNVALNEERLGVLKLLDLLAPRNTPFLILTPPGNRTLDALASDQVFLLPQDATPDVVAATLHTLAMRQPAFDALTTELNTARRFHGGLCDELDRIQEELQLAAHVQKQFIPPSLPDVEGLEFGALFRPCSYVSGDIYAIARLSDDLVGFYLADAVGHGVPAALMTMSLSKAMPSFDDTGEFVGPARSLQRLNTTLMRRPGNVQTFATAVCGVIDINTGVVTIAGAGHPPPLRISPNHINPVHTEGSLLGVFDEGEFNEVTFELDPSEILLLHSDGFETAFPDPALDNSRKSPSMRYLDHFRDLLEKRAKRSLAYAMTDLEQSLDQQAGSLHQVDDETALVIARAIPVTTF